MLDLTLSQLSFVFSALIQSDVIFHFFFFSIVAAGFQSLNEVNSVVFLESSKVAQLFAGRHGTAGW